MIKSVEKHERIRADGIERGRDVRKVAKIGAELHGERNCGFEPHGPDGIDVSFLDRRAGDLLFGWYFVDVEFQSIGARFCNLARVTNPSSQGRAIQARDDRNFDRAFCFSDVVQIHLRTDLELGWTLWRIRRGLFFE